MNMSSLSFFTQLIVHDFDPTKYPKVPFLPRLIGARLQLLPSRPNRHGLRQGPKRKETSSKSCWEGWRRAAGMRRIFPYIAQWKWALYIWLYMYRYNIVIVVIFYHILSIKSIILYIYFYIYIFIWYICTCIYVYMVGTLCQVVPWWDGIFQLRFIRVLKSVSELLPSLLMWLCCFELGYRQL